MDDILMMMTTAPIEARAHGKIKKVLDAGQRVMAVRNGYDNFIVYVGAEQKKAAEYRDGLLRIMPGFARL